MTKAKRDLRRIPIQDLTDEELHQLIATEVLPVLAKRGITVRVGVAEARKTRKKARKGRR